MKEKPLVSLIVPVYNGEKYIRECLDSILNQDYKNIELVIVDDGSKDNSPKIIDEYQAKDKRIKVIHKENGGVSAARNEALKIVTGDYLGLIDQDDCICEDYVSYMLNLINKNEAEIAIVPQAKKFSGEIDTKKYEIENEQSYVISGLKAVEKMFYYQIIIGPWNKIIRMNLVKKNNIWFNKDFFGGEGFSFSIDCFQYANRVAVGNKKVYLYRVDNPNSGTTKFNLKMIYSSIESQKFMRNNIKKMNKDIMKASRYSMWHTYCDCINTIVGCKVIKQNKELYKEIKKYCQREAVCIFTSAITLKEKMKGILYLINPYLAAKIINKFRIRKFTVEEN